MHGARRARAEHRWIAAGIATVLAAASGTGLLFAGVQIGHRYTTVTAVDATASTTVTSTRTTPGHTRVVTDHALPSTVVVARPGPTVYRPGQQVPGPTVTVTQQVPGPTVTQQVPGPTVTVTQPGPTVPAAPAPATS